MLGLTFKENCADIRNSKVVDIIRELKEYGLSVHIHGPQADAVVLAVAHREYLGMPIEALTASLQPGGCVIDVKSVLSRGNCLAWIRGLAVVVPQDRRWAGLNCPRGKCL